MWNLKHFNFASCVTLEIFSPPFVIVNLHQPLATNVSKIDLLYKLMLISRYTAKKILLKF